MGRSSTLSAAVLTASSASRSASFAGLPTTGAMLTTAPPRQSVAPPRRIGVVKSLVRTQPLVQHARRASTRRRGNVLGILLGWLRDEASGPARDLPSRGRASGVPEAGDQPSLRAGTAAGAGRATSHATPMLSQQRR